MKELIKREAEKQVQIAVQKGENKVKNKISPIVNTLDREIAKELDPLLDKLERKISDAVGDVNEDSMEEGEEEDNNIEKIKFERENLKNAKILSTNRNNDSYNFKKILRDITNNEMLAVFSKKDTIGFQTQIFPTKKFPIEKMSFFTNFKIEDLKCSKKICYGVSSNTIFKSDSEGVTSLISQKLVQNVALMWTLTTLCIISNKTELLVGGNTNHGIKKYQISDLTLPNPKFQFYPLQTLNSKIFQMQKPKWSNYLLYTLVQTSGLHFLDLTRGQVQFKTEFGLVGGGLEVSHGGDDRGLVVVYGEREMFLLDVVEDERRHFEIDNKEKLKKLKFVKENIFFLGLFEKKNKIGIFEFQRDLNVRILFYSEFENFEVIDIDWDCSNADFLIFSKNELKIFRVEEEGKSLLEKGCKKFENEISKKKIISNNEDRIVMEYEIIPIQKNKNSKFDFKKKNQFDLISEETILSSLGKNLKTQNRHFRMEQRLAEESMSMKEFKTEQTGSFKVYKIFLGFLTFFLFLAFLKKIIKGKKGCFKFKRKPKIHQNLREKNLDEKFAVELSNAT